MICYETVIKYCKDYQKIENYDRAISDKTQTWCCHHRLEFAPFSGKNVTVNRLIQLGMYYNIQPEALIFIPRKEHQSLHSKDNKTMLGRHHTEETKRKCSENNKGKHCWTEEMHRKHSEVNKGNTYAKGHKISEEARKKIAEAKKGKHWYTNGVDNIRCFECPIGYHKGRIIQRTSN